MSEKPRTCFVISPIGESTSDIRKNADDLLNYIITPVVQKYNYKTIRADAISQAGDITLQIIEKLIEADLVVADLTNHNANVLYELAIRHASRRPVVHMIENGQRPPFDVQNFRAIPHDVRNIAIAEQAKAELDRQVKHFDDDETISATNPIAIAVDIDFLKRSENITERSFASLLASIQNVQDDIQMLYGGLDSVFTDIHLQIEEVSRVKNLTGELRIPANMHVTALEKVISSFNSLVEEALDREDSLPKSLLLKIGNVQPYIRGLIFQTPLTEEEKRTLQNKIVHFSYKDIQW